MAGITCPAPATPPASTGKFIEGILNQVDYSVSQFLCPVSQNAGFSQYIYSMWHFAAILAITFIGFNFLFGGQSTVRDMVMQLFKIVFILMVITVAADFQAVFYYISTVWPDEISTHILNAGGSGTDSVNTKLDDFFKAGMDGGKKVLNAEGWVKGISGIITFVLIFVVTLIFTAAALILTILSKIVVAIMLSLGPLFVIGLLFERTRGFFEGWFKALMSFALIPIILYSLLALVLALLDSQIALMDLASEGKSLSILAPFIIMGVVGIALILQVQGIAAQIAGGIAMNTSAGISTVGRALRGGAGVAGRAGAGMAGRAGARGAKGAARAGRKAANRAGQSIRQGATRAAPVVRSAGQNAYQGMARLARSARSRLPTRTKTRSIGTE